MDLGEIGSSECWTQAVWRKIPVGRNTENSCDDMKRIGKCGIAERFSEPPFEKRYMRFQAPHHIQSRARLSARGSCHVPYPL